MLPVDIVEKILQTVIPQFPGITLPFEEKQTVKSVQNIYTYITSNINDIEKLLIFIEDISLEPLHHDSVVKRELTQDDKVEIKENIWSEYKASVKVTAISNNSDAEIFYHHIKNAFVSRIAKKIFSDNACQYKDFTYYIGSNPYEISQLSLRRCEIRVDFSYTSLLTLAEIYGKVNLPLNIIIKAYEPRN